MATKEGQCQWPTCSNPAGPAHFIYGRAYCPQHYFSGVELALIEEIARLEEGQPQSIRFLKLFRRYLEGLLIEKTPPGLAKLTPSQIAHRANLSYIDRNKIEFDIERHGSFIPVTYRFQLSIKGREITQISEEPQYLTVSEFAKRFEFTEQKVYTLIRARRLKAIRAALLQDQWYELMISSGREFVPKPWETRNLDFIPEDALLIPLGEIEKFSKSGKLKRKDKKVG